jgi:hypothetical protein
MLLQTAFFIGFGLWFFYDGAISYPQHNRRIGQFVMAYKRGEAKTWHEFAGRKGWPGLDHHLPYSSGEIRTQFVLGAVSAEVGVMVFVWFLISRKLKMTSDGQTVCGVRGQQVPLDAFVGVNKRKWDRKGIAYALYEENGKRRRLTIDDYKFVGGEDILKQIEERLAKKNEAQATKPESVELPERRSP